MGRVQDEHSYWQEAALDDDVDLKYIADVDTEACLEALAPIGDVFEHTTNGTLSILDLGCGVGRISIPIANKFIDFKVVGVDISQRMLDIANERYAKEAKEFAGEKVNNFSTQLTDGRTIPEKDGTFMAAYCMLLFQHLPRDAVAGYIKEVGRVLKPGGVFRFQFIDGKENEPFSKHHALIEIKRACQEAGLQVKQVDNAVHPLWTWVTATK